MAELINCIECGGQISSHARVCLHCKTEHPQGTHCGVCNEVMKQSEAVRPSGFSGDGGHPHCYEKVKTDTTICEVCHTEISGIPVEKCPKCGHPFNIENCTFCRGSLYRENAMERHKKDYDCSSTYYAHSFCLSFRLREKNYYKDWSSTKSSSSKVCFIATAACDPSAQELLVLRSFRDYYLEQNRLGQLFMKVYMQLSPPAARIISKSPVLRYLVRNLFVKPVAKAVDMFIKG